MTYCELDGGDGAADKRMEDLIHNRSKFFFANMYFL